MANKEHVERIRKGVEGWNEWRQDSLEKPDLSHADLSHADLRDAKLSAADISYADLSDATLSGAELFLARLTSATLSGADCTNAVLLDVDLTRVRLNGANFARSFFGTTSFIDVDLSNAVGLEASQHMFPSFIDHRTLERSPHLPQVFLRGCGLSDDFIAEIPRLFWQEEKFYACFIIYSHKDKAFAGRLHDRLQERGIRCWLDEHQILPGDKVHKAVTEGIRLWDKVLLCCSETSLRSWWVNNEIETALNKERRLQTERGKEVLALIPLNLDGHLFANEFEGEYKEQLHSRLAADFTGWEKDNAKFEEQFELVVKALRADDAAREAPPPPKL